MPGSYTSLCKYTTKDEHFDIHGVFKGEKHINVYDRHPSLQNKWNKAFWARGYYAATMGNVTEEVIKK